jgi:hypothetical protein
MQPVKAARQFLAVPSKLWVDMLAALRIVPYPLAAAVDRGVDHFDRAVDHFDRIATTFIWVFAAILCMFAAIRVWEVRRRA